MQATHLSGIISSYSLELIPSKRQTVLSSAVEVLSSSLPNPLNNQQKTNKKL